jgi:transposase InsO family protein
MVSQSKREYLARIKDRYRHAGRKNKKLILDEFCKVCGHHRKHAIRLLNSDGRRRKKKPGRASKYGSAEIQVLENIWLNADRPCSSRLVGMIPIWLPYYEKTYGYLEESVREKVLNAKARTLDRILGPVRKKHGTGRGLSGTKHGQYLKNSIPIKISHADVNEPGYMQADTVAHCGGSLDGDFVWSLTFTDIQSGWTENAAVWNKGEEGVHYQLKRIEEALPFQIKGFHSDNGGEFINWHLESYYRDRKKPVEMTRGRPGKKNDNPHVEQKNHTHVRLLLGWSRIEDPELIKEINEMYQAANLLTNFFCANRRLVYKERRGSRYYKRYDEPMTPADRLLASATLNEAQKTHLCEMKCNLDPYKLRKIIDVKQQSILRKVR